MQDDSYSVTINRSLEDLIPGFLKNRVAELHKLRELLQAKDYTEIARSGHRMKGVGSSYGFDHITVLGFRIEKAAAEKDDHSLISCVSAYADYLARVNVTYTGTKTITPGSA